MSSYGPPSPQDSSTAPQPWLSEQSRLLMAAPGGRARLRLRRPAVADAASCRGVHRTVRIHEWQVGGTDPVRRIAQYRAPTAELDRCSAARYRFLPLDRSSSIGRRRVVRNRGGRCRLLEERHADGVVVSDAADAVLTPAPRDGIRFGALPERRAVVRAPAGPPCSGGLWAEGRHRLRILVHATPPPASFGCSPPGRSRREHSGSGRRTPSCRRRSHNRRHRITISSCGSVARASRSATRISWRIVTSRRSIEQLSSHDDRGHTRTERAGPLLSTTGHGPRQHNTVRY
ncbi:hypothetical protein EV378_2119 [Pseudonocardia endophytica]|uniref:Uncharacterized protein n=1 Tax=Pseudonocardia endophytica TaxID=401976 RepID=A0A4R1HZF6_PSEEN|nr:hypothetical protein EV378_2119 [Pseudonocardia endophytica]